MAGAVLPVAEESGAPPGQRAFRPDVEGLRAVAVLLVVLFHANLPGVTGGFVGVDVFFVISGFVITGVLLRAQARGEGTSLLDFYARRARRILPASSLVLVVAVLATVVVLGSVYEVGVAIDGRWAALFLANVHFALTGTNYLSSQLPPSPLQNFWSLAVEEQFYVVYPALFWVVATWGSRVRFAARLTGLLGIVVVASFVLSVTQTASNPTTAFFSPFTRAWELALGGLVAVCAPRLARLPEELAVLLGWVGLAAVAVAAVTYTNTTPYPGAFAALPVVGTALVIAAGSRPLRQGPEAVLGLRPAQWLGRRSYSWYLWHWPLLVLAADRAGTLTLPLGRALLWVGVALVLAMATYRWIENPLRHSARLRASRRASLGLGALLVAGSLVVTSAVVWVDRSPTAAVSRPASTPVTGALLAAELAHLKATIAASTSITRLPDDLTPSLAAVQADGPWPPPRCFPGYGQFPPADCIFGDLHGRHTMVLLGDSHAAMWFVDLEELATQNHWRLVVMAMGACPAISLPVPNPPGWKQPGQPYAACAAWHSEALARIRALRPSLAVVSQEVYRSPDQGDYSFDTWRGANVSLVRSLAAVGTQAVILGNIPTPNISPQHPAAADSVAGPTCLSLHATDIQRCALATYALQGYRSAEAEAAAVTGAEYVHLTPWFCASTRCSPVVGNLQVYWDPYHVTATYSRFLLVPLALALDLPARS